MTLWYWEQRGGTLIEEFPVARRTADNGERFVDAVILPERARQRLPRGTWIDLSYSKVIVVQTKNKRLGMYLMGQTLFSRRLIEARCGAREVLSVALCRDTDAILEPFLREHPGCEVVVCPRSVCEAARVGQ